jgi:DNA-binding XRE family transcriptional regulator
MGMREWGDVERDLFPPGDEDRVSALEDDLRAQVRAYRLAEIRRARHLTQQQVAASLGVSKARVSQIEHGQADRTAIQGLASYVAALGGRLELVADFGDERIVIG